MENGWTGGQYSVLRVTSGALAAARLATAALDPACEHPAAATLGCATALALALGLGARSASMLTALALIWTAPLLAPPAVLCAWHALVAPAPYGSLTARGRPDPSGGWSMPSPVLALARGALVLQVALLAFEGPDAWGLAAVALAAVLACDPAWLPGRFPGETDRVFYDGDCGLCHRAVRFLLAEDRAGTSFRFAPLGGPSFGRALPAEERERLPDSFVVVTPDGDLRLRTAASVRALARLGGGWRALGAGLGLVPRGLADLGYDLLARFRGRLFARPEGTCPPIPPELADRFES